MNDYDITHRYDKSMLHFYDNCGPIKTIRAIYNVIVAGRIVCLVSVVHDDPGLYIQIGSLDAISTDEWFISDGKALMTLYAMHDDNGMLTSIRRSIDVSSIEAYVYPRLATIITCLWVPCDE